jgi:hypothetical protein
MYKVNVFEIWILLRVSQYHAMLSCIPVPWQINDRSALQSVFSSIIWPPLVSSENLPLLHVNGESISLSVIYQQYYINVRENRGDHYEWAIKRHWQPWLHTVQGEDKQNKDTGNLDYTRYRVKTNKTNNTGNLEYTRYRVKTNKTKTLATLITQDTGWRQTKQITQHKHIYNMDLNKTEVNSRAHDWQAVPTSYKTSNMLLIKPSRVGHFYIK